MPATTRAIRITDAYRARLVLLRDRAVLLGRWTVSIDDIDATGTAWLERAVTQLEVMQRAGVTLTAAYVAAFIAAETQRLAGRPDVRHDAVGLAQDGQPLADALAATLITVKTALKDGRAERTALGLGEQRARRLIASAALAAPRVALHDAIAGDERIAGWRRVTFGGCGACLAAADGVVYGPERPLKVHDHCRCTAEPVVRSVMEQHQRPTGRQVFDAMPRDQQDALLGDEKAELIRSRTVAFERLIQPQPMVLAEDGITERPLVALTS